MANNPSSISIRTTQTFIQLFVNANINATYTLAPTAWGVDNPVLVFTVTSITGNPGIALVIIGPRDVSNPNTPMTFMRMYVIGNGIFGFRAPLDNPEPSISILCPLCNGNNYYVVDIYIAGGGGG